MTASTSAGSGRTKTLLAVVVILLAFIIIGVLAQDQRTSTAYDPRSTGPTGTKAFVELLGSFGADVSVPDTFPPDDTDVAVMFTNSVPNERVDEVLEWVADGHTLVTTAVDSDLSPPGGQDNAGPHIGTDQIIEQGSCTIDALRDVRQIDRGPPTNFITSFEVASTDSSCFGDGGVAVVVLQQHGDGRILSIAGGPAFMNQRLGNEDNAALATAVAAPKPGTRVAIITDEAFSENELVGDVDLQSALFKIIGLGARLAALQLLIAVVAYALYKGRRLGRPLAEPQPVQIASSELVAAVGNLLQIMKEPRNATAVLRADARRELCVRLGLPYDASPELIAETIAARTPIDRDDAFTALTDGPITSDAELVAIANQIDTIREEVFHGHAP